ncbi:uncharacterized protein LOC115626925 [Scaptodrosophila lebanonensis]|uniref:Uncharacterized protein LOC115626925 n=1 Tax=Drosophila lebanonensis TaxID=7225 RepID=A0A6J2TTR4_DROLE|nr:uncharacterized protein LOC115626925 [Scaptodrosophila lebanonensis]
MVVRVRFSINGLPAVELQTYNKYYIGTRQHYEFCLQHESIEQDHAVIHCVRNGEVDVVTLMGRIFVNGREVRVQELTQRDANEDGVVRLRIGDVEAEMIFETDESSEKTIDVPTTYEALFEKRETENK